VIRFSAVGMTAFGNTGFCDRPLSFAIDWRNIVRCDSLMGLMTVLSERSFANGVCIMKGDSLRLLGSKQRDSKAEQLLLGCWLSSHDRLGFCVKAPNADQNTESIVAFAPNLSS
jgi:hypothetical protein